MSPHFHRFCELFAQLGLPDDVPSIAVFIQRHSPLDAAVRLEDAAFWTPAQAALLREQILADADWAEVVDQLNVALRQRTFPPVASKALIVSADHFEDSELLVAYYRLLEAGLEVDVASLRRGKINGKHGYQIEATVALRDVNVDDYVLLLLPGGKAPTDLRKEPAALRLAQAFFARNKAVAAICHGPQILISAGLLRGRCATCYPSVAEEMRAAGALYEDREVVVDGPLVTSRRPSDLPAFMRETVRLLPQSSL